MTGARALGMTLAAALAATLLLGACTSNDSGAIQTTAPPSPTLVPTIPTTLPSNLQSSLCGHLATLESTISQAQNSPGQAVTTVQSTLTQLASQLQADGEQLKSANQPVLSGLAQNVALGVNALRETLPQQGTLPPSIAAAFAEVNLALSKVPPGLCPGLPSASPSV